MKFNDGMEIKTEGPLRIIRKSDGYYVVGGGMLCAVGSIEEGIQYIKEELVGRFNSLKKGEQNG